MFVHTLRRVTRLVVGFLWPGYQAPAKEAAERASGSLTLFAGWGCDRKLRVHAHATVTMTVTLA